MISSERRLLNSCGSRSLGSPVSTLRVHGDELESKMLLDRDTTREREVMLSSSRSRSPAFGEPEVADPNRPVSLARGQISEDERKRRADEKRAAFLTSMSGVQAPQHAPDSASRPSSVHTRSTLEAARETAADVAPSSVRNDLFTVRSTAPGLSTSALVNVEHVSEHERKRRAEARRAAFLGTSVVVGIAEDRGMGGKGNNMGGVPQDESEESRVPCVLVQSPAIRMYSPSRSLGASTIHASLRTPSHHSPFIRGKHQVIFQKGLLPYPFVFC
jgi:hypothetical protein